MTTTNVTRAAGLLMNTMQGAAGKTGAVTEDGFSRIMDRTTHGGENSKKELGAKDLSAKDQSADDKTVMTKSAARLDRSSVSETASDREAEQAAKSKAADTQNAADAAEEGLADEKTQELLEEAVEEVKTAVKMELDLSEEELAIIMSELGLTGADLLRPETMQAIAMAAAGEIDEMSVLTNEALYQDIQQLTGMAEQITDQAKQQLQAGEEEFAKLLTQMEQPVQGEEEAMQMPELLQGEDLPLTEQAKPLPEPEEQAHLQEEETLGMQTQEEDPLAAQTQNPKTQSTQSAEPEQTVQPTEKRAQEQGKNPSHSEGQEGGSTGLQSFQRTDASLPEQAALRNQSEPVFELADTQRIMEQITEYIKVDIKPEMTEMMLRLQPETLGTLHIHLTAKEGAVTAQFMAENEAVKAVLEAQTMQLKESLQEQGVKVEAVEVSVASQEFNRSYAENGESQGGYQEPKKKGVRKIQLTEETSLEEMELSDEDRLAAEMMEQNGNTVDYTA